MRPSSAVRSVTEGFIEDKDEMVVMGDHDQIEEALSGPAPNLSDHVRQCRCLKEQFKRSLVGLAVCGRGKHRPLI